MPRGPKGEKRPADVIGNAVKVMRIATGEAKASAVSSPTPGVSSAGCRPPRSWPYASRPRRWRRPPSSLRFAPRSDHAWRQKDQQPPRLP
jgi:hypothetical protein